MIRIVHVITNLATGGAEVNLYNVVRALDPARFESHVVSLGQGGEFIERLRALGVGATTLDAHPFLSLGLGPLAGVVRVLRREKPHIVQTWLYHADLVGGLAGLLTRIPVIWNIRATLLDGPTSGGSMSRRTNMVAHVCAKISRKVPRRIIAGSHAAMEACLRHGYPPEKLRLILNGLDLERTKPDAAARAAVRAELGIADTTPVVGLVGRWDPAKDHATFLAAAPLLVATVPDVHFILCGRGVDDRNAVLTDAIRSNGLGARVSCLGFRADVPRVLAALDVLALSSSNEGFPNVVAEAMATGVPCVATRVGDAPLIVGDAGRIVPPRDPAALAAALQELLALPPAAMRAMGLAARERIVTRFSLDAAVARYERLYEEVARS
jgi:glycosyltransferase involved in cell wall biosynthesis